MNTTAQWCVICANSQDRGCGTCDNAVATALASQASIERHPALSNAAAGVVNAAVAAAVILIALILFSMLGCVSFGRMRRQEGRVCSPGTYPEAVLGIDLALHTAIVRRENEELAGARSLSYMSFHAICSGSVTVYMLDTFTKQIFYMFR